jgi:murein L,D-transpeptidase YafK
MPASRCIANGILNRLSSAASCGGSGKRLSKVAWVGGNGKALRGLSVRGAQALYRLPVLRSLLASAAIAAAAALVGCDIDKTPDITGRHMQPLSDAILAELDTKNMAKESPILIRIFKEESELELWKIDKSGRFALLRTYPICRWSGDLGPKLQEGDRQAPEGFYTVTPDLMNPYSRYHLAINTGFPNPFDRANGRSGASLMIHGDCVSAGCYAMTDEQITEVYSLAREAFFGDQRSFQIQAYPFRMTPLNMARHHNSPHLAFWKVLKQGYDHFEVTRKEPKVAVCDKHYVFDAQASGKFNPVERCPAYKVPQQIASAVRNKERRDDSLIAQLVARGVPALATTTDGQGGMNATFLAAVRANGGPGSDIRTASGTIPGHVHPPAESSSGFSTASLFSFASPTPRPALVQVASAAPNSGGGVLGGSAAQPPQARSEPTATTAKPGQTAPSGGSTRSTVDTKPADSKKVATAKPQASRPQKTASAEPEAKPASTSSLLSGAAPTVSAGGFSR